jgi:cell division control protein 45
MILTDPSQWVMLFDALKAETRKSTEKHVHVYVSSCDVDSVCSIRILESMFQMESITHGWMPVSRYQEIVDDFVKSYDEEDAITRYIVLVNCGASEDIAGVLDLAQRQNVCVIIFDSHRPVMHLANDGNHESQVYVIMDAEAEGVSLDDIPSAYEFDEGDDGDNESPYPENVDGSNVDSAPQDGANIDGDENGDGGRRKRSRTAESLSARRAAYYQSGIYHGKPTACVLYDLAYHLRQETSYFLWLAIVGLTDHLVHNKMSLNRYDQLCMQYENYVAKGGHLDDPEDVVNDDVGEIGGVSKPVCRIAREDDYRFGLVREWSLWDAMMNSPYVASRLQTYSEKGRERLEFLLAKIGIPLREAKSSFQFDMKPQYHHRLQEQLTLHGMSYNLGDCMFRSFQLQDGFNRCVMAVDLVYAMSALLECGPKTSDDDHLTHVERFWKSWEALGWTNESQKDLRRGMELAKKLQMALVADGGSVIAQRLYHNFRSFRVFDLSEHKLTNHSLLVHPMALQRMAEFLQDQYYHQSQTNKRKPVVLIAPKDENTGRCLVVGFQVAKQGNQGNRLGSAFVQAAEDVGAQSWHDMFSTNICELDSSAVERFKQELLRAISIDS